MDEKSIAKWIMLQKKLLFNGSVFSGYYRNEFI